MDFPANREYLMSTQATVTGGFSKWPGNHPGTYMYFLQMTFKREMIVSFIIIMISFSSMYVTAFTMQGLFSTGCVISVKLAYVFSICLKTAISLLIFLFRWILAKPKTVQHTAIQTLYKMVVVL